MMPLVRAMRLINAVEAGTLDGPALDILLSADAGRVAEISQLLVLNGQTRRMMSAQTTMNAFARSEKAMEALIKSPIALFCAANSLTALSEILSHPAAFRAFCSSDAARAHLRESSAAIAAINGEPDTAQTPWIACAAGLDSSSYPTLSSLLASESAWNAIKNSAEAIRSLFEYEASAQAVINNSSRLSDVVSSQTLMKALCEQPVGMALFARSVTAKMAIFGSDIALTAIAGSANATDILRASPGYTRFVTDSVVGSRSFGADPNGNYIVIGVSIGASAIGKSISVGTTKLGTTRQNSILVSSSFNNTASPNGLLMCPVKAPFSASTDYATAVTLYVGALRCDQ